MSKKSGQKRAEKTKKRQQKLKARESQLPHESTSIDRDDWPYERDDSDIETHPFTREYSDDIDPATIRRLMEREFAAILRRDSTLNQDPKSEALQKAQELCFEAMEARSDKQAIKLARQALTICPDCADAYNILGERADNVTEALGFYEAGVAAGRRALADEWDDLVEHDSFWGYLPTRPFMRSMQGLAECQWANGRRDEGLATYLEMLKLNSNDNQGMRYVVVPMLIEMNRDAEARKILTKYKENSCFALFNRALLEFRKSGDGEKAQKALRKAMKSNVYAVQEILFDRPSLEVPDGYAWGTSEEATCYVDLARRAWKMTAGAVAWLRKTTKDDPPVSRPEDDEDLDDVTAVLDLPQDDDGWEVSLTPWQNPDESFANAKSDGPCWALSISRLSDGFPLDSDIFTEPPSGDDVRNFLLDAMLEPTHGTPCRPSRIEFLETEVFDEIYDTLENLGIEASVPDDAEERRAEAMQPFATSEKFAGPLSDLPLAQGESWYYDCRQVEIVMQNDAGELTRPWVFLLVSQDDGPIRMFLSMDEPSAIDWVEELERAIRQPQTGEPRRPETVLVRSNDHRLLLASFCDQYGLDCRAADPADFELLDFFYQGLSQHMRGPVPHVAYVEIDGNTTEQLGSFFEASAAFYRRAPWQFTPSDSVWRVEPEGTSDQPWWGIVIGQNGETFGLALYDDWDSLVGMMTGKITGPELKSSVSCVCFNFEESHVLAGADLDAIEQFGWPIAAPEAYPLVYRTTPGSELHTPPAEEFRWLEAVLRTLPDFIQSGQSTGTAIAELADGACHVKLTRLGPNDIRPSTGRGKKKR